ncbi:hypothetical protein [Chroococcidiopsis thermalis]|uniref:Uncharacterized protein n=1 Tax=Chroococcidiopsis thermalis (strain PCC 7203) TaxID=251229 RepID=K9U9C5_CHRTP|nr:hypothetical protein [Chroococcidiopsis thermalis]AFY91208.1 hypothetical protein Chro_5870 [Chroococcidiopsis thermalis PCC 7203]
MKRHQQQKAQLVMLPIPKEKLANFIGKQIHLAWAKQGCTWKLLRIEGDRIYLETPKKKKLLVAKASDAMYTRRYEG